MGEQWGGDVEPILVKKRGRRKKRNKKNLCVCVCWCVKIRHQDSGCRNRTTTTSESRDCQVKTINKPCVPCCLTGQVGETTSALGGLDGSIQVGLLGWHLLGVSSFLWAFCFVLFDFFSFSKLFIFPFFIFKNGVLSFFHFSVLSCLGKKERRRKDATTT